MATTVVPVGEYLHTLYRPDCDYVDGEIQERLFGEGDHSLVLGALLHLLERHDNGEHCKALPSLRVKIRQPLPCR